MKGIRVLLVCAVALSTLVCSTIPAAAAQSYLGYSGLLLTPTTEVLAERQFSLGAYLLDFGKDSDVMAYTAEVGISENLEVGLAVLDPDEGDADSDTQLNVKYALLPETLTRPAVSVGAFGLASDVDETFYVVVGKSLNPPSGLSYSSLSAPSLFLGFAGGEMDGLFGGVSAVLGNRVTLMVEHDTENFNLGARLAISDKLRVHAGIFDFDFKMFGVGLSFYSGF